MAQVEDLHVRQHRVRPHCGMPDFGMLDAAYAPWRDGTIDFRT
jgi:hypothetical protein